MEKEELNVEHIRTVRGYNKEPLTCLSSFNNPHTGEYANAVQVLCLLVRVYVCNGNVCVFERDDVLLLHGTLRLCVVASQDRELCSLAMQTSPSTYGTCIPRMILCLNKR